MKRIPFLLFWLLLYSLGYAQNIKTEKAILKKVIALPEFKLFFDTAKKSRPQLMIAGTPDKNRKYYWVKVGLANLEIFRTSFNLYVDPKGFKIYYLDSFTTSGTKLITLEQWRKWRNLPLWQQLHCYKYQEKRLIIYTCNPS
jgi:hypothetical protein